MDKTDGDDMELPAGKTCRDCRHFARCEWLAAADGPETSCDWSPSRFAEEPAPAEPPAPPRTLLDRAGPIEGQRSFLEGDE